MINRHHWIGDSLALPNLLTTLTGVFLADMARPSGVKLSLGRFSQTKRKLQWDLFKAPEVFSAYRPEKAPFH
jgi:hypothetical protein